MDYRKPRHTVRTGPEGKEAKKIIKMMSSKGWG